MVSITTARKSWRSGCIFPVDSKMIGRNLRPFCAHMTSYSFFFLAQALSATRRFCLASIKESLCLELGPGSGWTTVVSNNSSDILPSGLSGTNGKVVGFLPSYLAVDWDMFRTVKSPRLLQSSELAWKIPRSSLVEHMPATLSIDWNSKFQESWFGCDIHLLHTQTSVSPLNHSLHA